MTRLTPSSSFWHAAKLPQFAPLTENLHVDVCIVGAGIAGLTTAYLLSKQGLKTAVIDALDIGGGETGHTTAHLSVPDEGFAQLEHLYGETGARLVADSFAKCIDQVEAIVRNENIACDFRRVDGYLYSVLDPSGAALSDEADAAGRAGVSVFWARDIDGLAFDVGSCLRFPDQAQFHPLQYLAGLAAAVVLNGGQIYCDTRAQEIVEEGDAVRVVTANGVVHCRAAVAATHTPFNDRVTMHTKQAGYQSYVQAYKVPRDALPGVLIWDDAEFYHYVRLASATDADADYEVLIVGGEDHKTGQEAHPEQRHRALEKWTREHFPMAGEMISRWSGEYLEPIDGVAFLGRNPHSKNVYVITGDSGDGMTHSTLGAMIVTDLIQGRSNLWADFYDPARKPLKGAMEFMKEQGNVLRQYAQWLRRDEAVDIESLAPGDGAIVQFGLKKLAVYRDEQGALHAHSAVCTHLGCVVRWNSSDKTWDCPCHGSRFGGTGEVLHGPAVAALAPASHEAQLELTASHTARPRTRPTHVSKE